MATNGGHLDSILAQCDPAWEGTWTREGLLRGRDRLTVGEDLDRWRALVARARQDRQDAFRGLQSCGTVAAYNRHRYRGEPACEPCLAAARERNRGAWC
jgi:hypothetical protein